MLYRRLLFNTSQEVVDFADDHLRRTSVDSPLRWTRSFSVCIRREDHFVDLESRLAALLVCMPRLEAYHSWNPITSSELRVVAAPSHPNVRAIAIVLGSHLSFDTGMNLLSASHTLLELDILVSQHCHPTQDFDAPGATFFALAVLGLRATEESMTPVLRYLSKSCFPSLDRFLLCVDILDASDMDALSPFFDAHPRIRALTLLTLPSSLSVFFRSPCLIPELTFFRTVPPASILGGLGPATHILTLSSYFPYSEDRALWTLLGALATAAPRLAVRTVRIEPLPGHRWDGPARSGEQHAFLGKLVSWALRLEKVGVRIVDEEGRNVRDAVA